MAKNGFDGPSFVDIDIGEEMFDLVCVDTDGHLVLNNTSSGLPW